MPDEQFQFQNFTQQEVKEAIKQDIVQLKEQKRFSLYELYNLAEKREQEQQSRIDNVPDDVSKASTYKSERKAELKQLKRHHEDLLGAKSQRRDVEKIRESINKKRNREGQLPIDSIEREYAKNTLQKDVSVNDIFVNQMEMPERALIFSTIEEQCKIILKSDELLEANDLKGRVTDMLAKISELDKDFNVFGAYKITFLDERARERLLTDQPKVFMMMLRQGALQGAYNELTSHIADGGVDNVDLKKVGDIHKELVVGNLLINEFNNTSNYSYIAEPTIAENKVMSDQRFIFNSTNVLHKRSIVENKVAAPYNLKYENTDAYIEKKEKVKALMEQRKQKLRQRDIKNIKAKYPIPQDASEDAKMHIFYYRMAALLEIDDYYKKPEELDKYKNLQDVKDEVDNLDDFNNHWPAELIEKVVDMQTMDRLFGVQRERTDYRGLFTRTDISKTESDGKKVNGYDYSYKDVWANEMKASQYFRNDLSKNRVNRGMNISLATKLANLRIADYKDLFDTLSKDNFKKLEANISQAQTDIKYNRVVLFRKDLYKVNSNLNIIDEVMEKDCPFHTYNADINSVLSGEKILEEKKPYERPANFREGELSKWLEQNKENKEKVKDLSDVYDKIEAFFNEFKEAEPEKTKESKKSGNWLRTSYYKKFGEMAKAIRQWQDKKDKSEEEQKACKDLTSLYCRIYGANSLGKSDAVDYIQKAVEECQKADAAVELYHYLRLKGQEKEKLDECDKKTFAGANEQEKKKAKDDAKAAISERYAAARERIVSDQTDVPLFPHRPCVEDIMQAGFGDCYLLASIAAIVKNYPERITSMMEDYGKIVKVTFDTNHSVYVSKRIITTTSASNTLWVQVLEKAYGKAFVDSTKPIKDVEENITHLIPFFKNDTKVDEFFKDQEKPSAETYLKKVYYTTSMWMDGGKTQEALNNLLSFKNTQDKRQNFAFTTGGLNTTRVFYEKLWKQTIKNNASYKDSDLKSFIQQYIQEELLQEMMFRYRDKDYAAYRAVTIDDMKDTLNDIKNWKHHERGNWKKVEYNVFDDLLTELKIRFPEANEAKIMDCMKQMGEDLMKAGLKQDAKDDITFGYRTDLTSKTPNYTPKAMEWYHTIEKACGDKLAVACGSKNFGDVFDVIKNLEEQNNTKNGIAQNHAFTVLKAYEKDGHYFITLRNPWGTGTTEYRRKTNENGSVEITTGFVREEGGEFTLELNDFMNSYDVLSIVDSTEQEQWDEKIMQEKQRKNKNKPV